MKKEFKYKLVEPIKVHVDGKEVSSNDVIVRSPRPKDKIENLKVEGILNVAFNDLLSKIPEEGNGSASKDTEESAASSGTVKKATEDDYKLFERSVVPAIPLDNMRLLEISFNNILCGGNIENPNAAIGGIKFTKPLCEEICLKDYKALIARYYVDFLLLD